MHRDLNQPKLDLKTPQFSTQNYSKIKFKSLFPVIESSLEDSRIWVSDFQEDEIFVPDDLYDIVSAYAHFYGQIRNSA